MSRAMRRESKFANMSPLHYTLRSLPPVYDVIFDHLSPLSLIRVSFTCKDGKNATQKYKHRAFSIDRILSRFFNDPLEFRSLQARTGTLISGSQALQFFRRCRWSESDLDIYTWPGHTLEVGAWLLKEGYSFTPNSLQPPNFLDIEDEYAFTQNTGWWIHHPTTEIDSQQGQLYHIANIRTVLSFEKQVGADKLSVKIIGAKKSPMEIILKCHSTAVMNFISWNKAYSLYPYATLEKSRSLISFTPGSPSPNYDKALKKYTARGLTMVSTVYAHEDKRCVFRQGYRVVSDQHTWIMNLETRGIQPPIPHSSLSPHFDRYLANAWEMETTMDTFRPYNGQICRLRSSTHMISCSILRYAYAAPGCFVSYAIPFLIEQGHLEHATLTAEEAEIYGGREKSKPSFWHYYDEELVELLHQWLHDYPNKDRTKLLLSEAQCI